MNISIERATAADADELVRVEIAAFHHNATIFPGIEPGGPTGHDSVEHMLGNIQQHECYTIADAGRCIGGMVANDKGEGHYHLDLIFIDPAYHSRGVGTQAMQFIESAYPAVLWTLDTPQFAGRNRRFYEKLGYVNVREYLEGDFPLVAYEKRIIR